MLALPVNGQWSTAEAQHAHGVSSSITTSPPSYYNASNNTSALLSCSQHKHSHNKVYKSIGTNTSGRPCFNLLTVKTIAVQILTQNAWLERQHSTGCVFTHLGSTKQCWTPTKSKVQLPTSSAKLIFDIRQSTCHWYHPRCMTIVARASGSIANQLCYMPEERANNDLNKPYH